MKASSSKTCPEFFKFYSAAVSSQRLKIPSAFVEYLGDNVPQTATLKDETGKCQKTWQVELKQREDGVYMEDGWQGFVQDNPIEEGNFLVFSSYPNSTFSVKLFGPNACLKRLGTVKKQTRIITVKEEEDQTEPEPETEPLPAPLEKLRQPEPVAQEMRYKRIDAEVNPRRDADRRICKVPESGIQKCPSFTKLLGKSSQRVMYLHLGLIRDHKIKFDSSIKLVNNSGMYWDAKILESTDGRLFLSAGWSKFFTENGLKLHDQCIFEYVLEEEEGTMCREVRVTILRSNSNCCSSENQG